MASDVMERIKADVEGNKILLYIKGTKEMPMCGFSAATIGLFQSLGVPFQTVDVLADSEVREAIKEYTNWPTIPQVFINGEFIGGCDIVHEMHERGELEPLVKAAVGGK